MTKKYPQFRQIVDTMTQADYDYAKDYQRTLANYRKRQGGHQFTLTEHVQALVYAMLSNMQEWDRIRQKLNEINAIFHNFDVNYIKNADPLELYQQIKDIKCGNISIKSQMLALKYNIDTLERIANDHGSIDEYYNNTPRDELLKSLATPNGKYKLRGLGIPLVSEYLKNVGVNIVKPDRHLCRLIARLGYTPHGVATEQETLKICQEIAQEYGLTDIEVDSILWQYCANKYFECCTDEPNCSRCHVTECKYRKNCCEVSENDAGIGEGHIFLHEKSGYSSFGMSADNNREIIIKDRVFTINYRILTMIRDTQRKLINDDNYAELIAMMRKYKNILNQDTTPAYERFRTGYPTMYNYDFEGRSNHNDAGGLFVSRDATLQAEAYKAYETVIQKIINQQ